MESSIVIKVKHGDTLRRFIACVVNEELELNMDGLREKIISLFKFSPDTQLHFTYNDEDNDMVSLIDDEDLHDVVRQALNPLRINVSLSTSKSSSPSLPEPIREPLQEKLRNLNSNFSEILKAFPEPIREPLAKLSYVLAKKASPCGASNIAEITDSLSKLVFHFLNQLAEFPSTGEFKKLAEAYKDSDGSKNLVAPTEVTSGASCGKSTSRKTKKVLQRSKSSFKNKRLDLQGVSQAPGSNAHVVSKDKHEVKETGAPPVAKNVCPSTGMPIISDKAAPHVSPREMPERIFSFSHGIFHRGIRCDGCHVHPITGPRFKSKVKEDYDLCSICFAKMGNDADFTKIDHPVIYRHPLSFKGSYTHNGPVPSLALPQIFKCHGAESSPLELDSRFILDVKILDGTIMTPLTHFTKIWRIKNNGTTVWPQGTRLAWIGGVKMTTSPFIELEIAADGVQVDQELNVAADFIAPELDGRHISYWRTTLPTGQKFGQLVWVLIDVDASLKKAKHAATRPIFNLNLPPASESVTASELDVPIQEPMMVRMLSELNISNAFAKTADAPVPDPMVDQSLPEPNDPNASGETIEPVVHGQVSKEQEAKFPIDDSLLVGGNDILASDELNAYAQTMEEKLLKELEEMGFKHASLNEEILEKNKYDLEKTVDELCGCSEWDPIHEELEEMGFHDKDVNKRPMRKSNGSIRRMIIDLFGEESE